MALNISNGRVRRAQRVVLYGPEGIGKSTFAGEFPGAIFMDLEDGTSNLDVNRVEWGSTWKNLLETISEVVKNKDICETLVIDTADKAEQLCIEYVCESKKVSGIEDIGYGKGYTYVGEEFAKMLSYLDNVIKCGINVVVLAHAKMRKFEQPDEMGAYDRWELKLSKQAGPLLKEWADMVLFCNYKTSVAKTKEGTVKAQGGKRVIYTSHHPCWDAKNRHYLPEMISMDYKEIKDVIEYLNEPKKADNAPKTEAKPVEEKKTPAAKAQKSPMPIEELRGKMLMAGIRDEDVQKACAMKKLMNESIPIDRYPDDFIEGMLLAHWDKFHSFILKNVLNAPEQWVNK